MSTAVSSWATETTLPKASPARRNAGVPLMLGTGTGSEIRQPLGYTIVGGLIFSQILTLYTTPVVYLYLDRLGGFLQRKGRTVENPGATDLTGSSGSP